MMTRKSPNIAESKKNIDVDVGTSQIDPAERCLERKNQTTISAAVVIADMNGSTLNAVR